MSKYIDNLWYIITTPAFLSRYSEIETIGQVGIFLCILFLGMSLPFIIAFVIEQEYSKTIFKKHCLVFLVFVLLAIYPQIVVPVLAIIGINLLVKNIKEWFELYNIREKNKLETNVFPSSSSSDTSSYYEERKSCYGGGDCATCSNNIASSYHDARDCSYCG